MVILHFILGKANPDRANGVNQVIYGLAKYQSLQGHKVYVLGISKSMKESYEIIDRKYFKVEAFRKFGNHVFDRIEELIPIVDIAHLHGVWNMFNIKLGKYLKFNNIPYVMTAHCGLSLDRLKQSNYYAKLIYHKLWQKNLYENAAGIHALTREEATDISRFCENNNIFVVSNGVDPDVFENNRYQIHTGREKIKLGYLGRISIEKNVDNLIRSIALLPKDIRNVIELSLIGPINSSVERLQKLANQLGVKDCLKFVGSKFGEEKIQALLDLDIYVHPAYSDVVGIAVMEAMALGIPTIVTRTSHMSYFYPSQAFFMVEPTASDLCRGIYTAIKCRNEWCKYSSNARKLYLEQFNWRTAVNSLSKEYYNIIKGIV